MPFLLMMLQIVVRLWITCQWDGHGDGQGHGQAFLMIVVMTMDYSIVMLMATSTIGVRRLSDLLGAAFDQISHVHLMIFP